MGQCNDLSLIWRRLAASSFRFAKFKIMNLRFTIIALLNAYWLLLVFVVVAVVAIVVIVAVKYAELLLCLLSNFSWVFIFRISNGLVHCGHYFVDVILRFKCYMFRLYFSFWLYMIQCANATHGLKCDKFSRKR